MRWSFGDDADMEVELVNRIMDADGEGYNLDLELLNGTTIVTGMSRALDTTIEHHCRLLSVDWDGWLMKFLILDEHYEPTEETIVVSPDAIVNLHVC